MVFEVIIQYILCKTGNLILKLNLAVLPYIQFARIETYDSSSYVSTWSVKKIRPLTLRHSVVSLRTAAHQAPLSVHGSTNMQK